MKRVVAPNTIGHQGDRDDVSVYTSVCWIALRNHLIQYHFQYINYNTPLLILDDKIVEGSQITE